jgi:hypothetical protein
MSLESKLKKLLRVITGRSGEPPKPSCSVCGRPLYAASSIIRGMGTTCAGRHARKDVHTLDMFEGGTVGSEHGCG